MNGPRKSFPLRLNGENRSSTRPRRSVLLLGFIALAAWLSGTLVVYSQDEGAILADDFESGLPCAWSRVEGSIGFEPTIESVLPSEGSAGSEIMIEGLGLGHGEPTVTIGDVAIEVLAFEPGRIHARLPSTLSTPVGLYDVEVTTPCAGQTETVYDAGALSVRLPSGLVTSTRFVEPSTRLVVSGRFLGSQPGRVILRPRENPVIVHEATVLAWANDPVTANGAVEIIVPSTLTENGLYDLEIVNALGDASPGPVAVAGVDTGDTTGPSLVSAVATSSSEVLLQFSEPVMGGTEGAENPLHYSIAALDSRIPTVDVVRAEMYFPDLTNVRLTTIAQHDLVYTLHVVGIRDLAGNPLTSGSVQFVGRPPSGPMVDSDGDGLSDAEEQLGWTVEVVYSNDRVETRHVTSNPGVPGLPVSDPINVAARDTDADGVSDLGERSAGTDPRSVDTDGDLLRDWHEMVSLFSDPRRQDTDGDGLDDEPEVARFKTSPLLADTDGDQLSDAMEVASSNRNALLSDLPTPRIQVGNIDLRLDTRFSFTDESGQSASEDQSVESTLTRGEDETFSTSRATSNTSTIQNSFEISAGVEWSLDPKKFLGGSVTTKYNRNWGSERNSTFTSGQDSSRSSEESYHDSLTTSTARDLRESITREVVDAEVAVDITIDNLGDLPFTISNLELSAQAQDARDRRRMVPIASLVPENANLDEIHLGVLGDSTRGPFVFKAISVFPQQVEELMKNPRGLVVQLANYDITDESGRNFAFSSQDVIDRTAGITFDLGDGRVESYRVATASAFDPATGEPLGITMAYAFQDILGLQPTATIRGGGNGIAETSAMGDDVQIVAIGGSLEPGRVVVTAGSNGVLESVAVGDDVVVAADYETVVLKEAKRILDGGNGLADTEAAGDDIQWVASGLAVGPDEAIITAGPDGVLDTVPSGDDFVKAPAPPHRVLSGFRDVFTDAASRSFWILFTSEDLPPTDLGDLVLRAGEQYDFTYVQDRDEDGVWAREEYLYGSSDLLANSDSCDRLPADNCDTLGDREEIQDGWRVQVKGMDESYAVYSNPVQGDSDRDQLLDHYERDCRLDPRQRDSDLDGLTDWEELAGRLLVGGGPGGQMVSRDPETDAIVYTLVPYAGDPGDGRAFHDVIENCRPEGFDPGFATDPLDPDTDGDKVPDGAELRLGLNPNDPADGALFLDDDGDGVPNQLEREGYIATVNGENQRHTSNPNDSDTDNDGLPDLLERFLGSDPRNNDTDGDGLTDANEYRNGGLACVTVKSGVLCERFADLLNDSYFEYLAACRAAERCDHPTIEDALLTGGSKQLGTNLNEQDSDFDGVGDREELDEQQIEVNGELIVALPSDPLDPNSDADSLNDYEERINGTDPNKEDTDEDGVEDDREVELGRDPAYRDLRLILTASTTIEWCTLPGCEAEWEASVSFDEGQNFTEVCAWKHRVSDGSVVPEECNFSSPWPIRDDGSFVTIKMTGRMKATLLGEVLDTVSCHTKNEVYFYSDGTGSRTVSQTCGSIAGELETTLDAIVID